VELELAIQQVRNVINPEQCYSYVIHVYHKCARVLKNMLVMIDEPHIADKLFQNLFRFCVP